MLTAAMPHNKGAISNNVILPLCSKPTQSILDWKEGNIIYNEHISLINNIQLKMITQESDENFASVRFKQGKMAVSALQKVKTSVMRAAILIEEDVNVVIRYCKMKSSTQLDSLASNWCLAWLKISTMFLFSGAQLLRKMQ